MDAVVMVIGGRPLVLMGRSGPNHWLTLNLNGTRSNRDGMGAVVRTGSQRAYATTAGSYLSASDRRVHFGLGAATSADVEILWPSGQRQILSKVGVDRILSVEEPRE
jgi:hypothetical protein